MALEVDPIFAGDLPRLCGSAVWNEVRVRVGSILREWHAVDEGHHRQCALAAMLATGSGDFADILLLRFTDGDRNVRMSTYEAGDAFHPTSLGADWRRVVPSWAEDARADFVYEVTHRGHIADIGESFAMNDTSADVRKQAIQALCWIGATDSLTRVVNALDNDGLEAVLPAFFPETTSRRPRRIGAQERTRTVRMGTSLCRCLENETQ